MSGKPDAGEARAAFDLAQAAYAEHGAIPYGAFADAARALAETAPAGSPVRRVLGDALARAAAEASVAETRRLDSDRRAAFAAYAAALGLHDVIARPCACSQSANYQLGQQHLADLQRVR